MSDEGVGCGFDNLNPNAYAARHVEVDAGASEVLTWFSERFVELGWSALAPMPTTGMAYMRFGRDEGEDLGVYLQGVGHHWRTHRNRAVKWSKGKNSMRVHLWVHGTFPDGHSRFQVG